MVKRLHANKKKSYWEEINEKVNEALCAVDAKLPWFDILVFLKYFSCSVCIYLIAYSSLTVLACIVAYRIFRDIEVPLKPARGKNKSPGIPIFPPNPEFRITLSMVYELVVRFLFEFGMLVLISFISYLGLALLAFVVACYASVLEAGTSLDDRLILEEMDENTLLLLLHRLGHRVPKWLSTPDHQRVEWLNKIILKLWPHIGHNIEDMMERMIKEFKSELKVKELNHGDSAPRVSSVKIRERDEQMFIDVSIIYAGDFLACVEWHTGIEFKVECKEVQADIQIELKNFVDYKPFVETLVVHMDKPPIINPTFKKLASSIEFKPLKKIILECVQKAVQDNFPLTIQLGPDDAERPIENLNYPQGE